MVLSVLVSLLVMGALVAGPTMAQPNLPDGSPATPCALGAGFADLRDQVGEDLVGTCTEPASADAAGNVRQVTTTGLVVWRKVDNTPMFTDGSTTWLLGPSGLESRPNALLLAWEPTPTRTPLVAATPALAVPDVAVVARAFGASGGQGLALGYGAILENRRADQVAVNITYQVLGYDDTGGVLVADAGTVERLAPGGRIGIAGALALDAFIGAGRAVTRLDARVTSASFVPAASMAAATVGVEGVTYRGQDVALTVTNSGAGTLGLARLAALGYAADGSIVAAGVSYAGALPAGGRTTTTVPLTQWGTPVRVEVSVLTTTRTPAAS